MSELIRNQIKQCLHSAEGLYHRLVLLVGSAGSGKTDLLRCLAGEFNTPVFNLNLALSAELLELTSKQRALKLPAILGQIVEQALPPVILDNLEILFDRDLKQDPLRLLRGIARNRLVVASWNGRSTDGKLLYAEPGHPEYRAYDATDVLIVGRDGGSFDQCGKKYRGAGS